MRNLFDNPLLLIVLLLIIVLVFGAKRLPDAARSVGRSMRIFKTEVKEMKEEDQRDERGSAAPPLEGRVVEDRRTRDARTENPHRADDPHRGV